MILATIAIGAPLLLVSYLVLAYRTRRVTHMPDGTRLTWCPLMPGAWSEEFRPLNRCRTREDYIAREAQVSAHIARCRATDKANRRWAGLPDETIAPRLPIKQRVISFAARAAKATHSTLR